DWHKVFPLAKTKQNASPPHEGSGLAFEHLSTAAVEHLVPELAVLVHEAVVVRAGPRSRLRRGRGGRGRRRSTIRVRAGEIGLARVDRLNVVEIARVAVGQSGGRKRQHGRREESDT